MWPLGTWFNFEHGAAWLELMVFSDLNDSVILGEEVACVLSPEQAKHQKRFGAAGQDVVGQCHSSGMQFLIPWERRKGQQELPKEFLRQLLQCSWTGPVSISDDFLVLLAGLHACCRHVHMCPHGCQTANVPLLQMGVSALFALLYNYWIIYPRYLGSIRQHELKSKAKKRLSRSLMQLLNQWSFWSRSFTFISRTNKETSSWDHEIALP